jgi:tetratricopeptide (TPR) repeat protein
VRTASVPNGWMPAVSLSRTGNVHSMSDPADQAIPVTAYPAVRDEVLREVARISQSGLLSQQERLLLRTVVERTLDSQLDRLFQKALAEDLNMPDAKQVGVVATRLRSKLAEIQRTDTTAAVTITLPNRGYEAWFAYRQPAYAADARIQLASANARAAIDQRTLPGFAKALDHLNAGLAGAPDHPLLLALKAHCHTTRALYGSGARADLEAAQALVTNAPATPRPWESHFAEGCVQMALHWNWAAAKAAFDRAIVLSHGVARFLPWYTAFLASQGRAAEAVPLLRQAVSQSHDSPIVRADLAANQIYAGHYRDALDTIDTAFSLFGERTHYLLHVHRAILQEAIGDATAAARTIEHVPLKWPQTTVTLGLRALFSGLAGDRRTARRHLAKLRAGRAIASRFVPAGQLGIAALGAGDTAAAIEWLRQGAVVERDPNLVLINVYPFLRHLDGHAAFEALVADTMSLPAARSQSVPNH